MEKPDKFDPNIPIDVKKALVIYGGFDDIFWEMLGKFERSSLRPALFKLASGMNKNNLSKIKTGVHNLLGASAYVGAG